MSQLPNESSNEPRAASPVLPYDEPRARRGQQPWIRNPAAEWSLKFGWATIAALLVARFFVPAVPTDALVAVSACSIGVFIICTIVAAITGVVGLRRAMRPGVAGRGNAIGGLMIGILGLVLVVVGGGLIVALNRAEQRAQEIKCQAHLRMIGQCCLIYQCDHKAYPQRIEQLVAVDLGAVEFVCPSSDDEPARVDTDDLRALAAEVAKPGHCSYIYLGAGLNSTSPPTAPVACDRLSNHAGRGIHVLYANGTVAWLNRAQAEKFLSSLPPTAQHPATRPAR